MKKKVITGLALGVITLGILGAFGDFKKVYHIITHFNLLLIVLVLLLSLVNYTIRFVKWQYFLYILGHKVNWLDSFLIYYSGLSMAVTPGKFGEVIKSSLLSSMADVGEHESLPVVITERLLDLVSVLLLIAAGISGVVHSPGVLIAGIILTGILFILFVTDFFGKKMYALLGRILLKKLGKEHLDTALKNQKKLLSPAPFLIGTIISAIAWASEATGMYIIVRGLHGSINYLDSIFVYATGTLAGAISMIPGGLIATEASLTGLLEGMHVFDNRSYAVAATILVRLCTLWFAVLVGGIALLILRKHLRSKREKTVTH